MKKLLALALVAVLSVSSLVLASCGDKDESSAASDSSVASTDSSVVSTDSSAASTDESATSADESATSADESATSADESAASADESAVSADESAVSEEATSEEAPVEIPEEVKATASYKYFASIDMTKGYTLKTDLMGMAISMSVLGENVYMETSIEMEGLSETVKVIYKDGKSYMINDAEKSYMVSDATEEDIPVESFSINDIFGGLEYVSTTTEEVEGVTYTVDNFKFTETEEDAKIYMDAEGKVVMMGDDSGVVPMELTNVIPEGCFDIPADYTEVIEEDISVDLGDLSLDLGDLSLDLGDLSIDLGDLSIDLGDLSIDLGDLSIDLGDLSVESAEETADDEAAAE